MRLFRETVLAVNARDYSPAALAVWAPPDLDRAVWGARMARHETWVADDVGDVVGFAELAPPDMLHMLYVHKCRLGQGIGTALLSQSEATARRLGASSVRVVASTTARPFFAKLGFTMQGQQNIERAGVSLLTYRMQKLL